MWISIVSAPMDGRIILADNPDWLSPQAIRWRSAISDGKTGFWQYEEGFLHKMMGKANPTVWTKLVRAHERDTSTKHSWPELKPSIDVCNIDEITK